jgi:acylphosphatase
MPDDALARLDATAFGRVQGVGFRYFVLSHAAGLGLAGWVANTTDGAVRCVAEGPRDQLELLLEQIRVGPGSATVDRVSEAWMAPTGTLGTFSVRSGAHPGD